MADLRSLGPLAVNGIAPSFHSPRNDARRNRTRGNRRSCRAARKSRCGKSPATRLRGLSANALPSSGARTRSPSPRLTLGVVDEMDDAVHRLVSFVCEQFDFGALAKTGRQVFEGLPDRVTRSLRGPEMVGGGAGAAFRARPPGSYRAATRLK